MKTKILTLLLLLFVVTGYSKKTVKPLFFPKSEKKLVENNATVTVEGLFIDGKRISKWGKVRSIYVYVITEKKNAIRVELVKSPRERVEFDFTKNPVEVIRYLKKKGKWLPRKGKVEKLITG